MHSRLPREEQICPRSSTSPSRQKIPTFCSAAAPPPDSRFAPACSRLALVLPPSSPCALDWPGDIQLTPALSTPNSRLAPVDSWLAPPPPRLLTHARGLSSRPLSATVAAPSALSRNCGDPFSTLPEFLTSLAIRLRADLCSPT
jgi:hypothetical protein